VPYSLPECTQCAHLPSLGHWACRWIHRRVCDERPARRRTHSYPPSHPPPVLIGWLHGTVVKRRSLAGELPCPALDLQLTGDHLCGQTARYRSTNKANSAFHPFGVDKWVVSCNWMSATTLRGGTIWWTLTKERQAWCNLQVKLRDTCLSALWLQHTKMTLYKSSSFPLCFISHQHKWLVTYQNGIPFTRSNVLVITRLNAENFNDATNSITTTPNIYSTIYTVSQKNGWHLTPAHNFAKCPPIFKDFSPTVIYMQ